MDYIIRKLRQSKAISVLKEYRGLGIGSKLMKQILKALKEQGYKQVSLSVQKENYAVDMYKKVGFRILNENKEDYIMISTLLNSNL
jgi:acetyltransferase, GNAT family